MIFYPKRVFNTWLGIVFVALSLSHSAAYADYSTNEAPDCSQAYADPGNIWSPNHKFEPVEVAGVADPDGDSFALVIQCIIQDEPVNDLGDGNTQWDASGINESSASVLSERAGLLNGRVYHIDYIATDIHGARCGGEVLVSVDHRRSQPAVDDGRLYSSVPSSNQCGQHDINNAPYITSHPIVSATSCNAYRYSVAANDPDRDALTYALVSGPGGAELDPASGILQWDAPAEGNHAITIEVSDNRGGSGRQSFTLTVISPTLEITSEPVTSVVEDESYLYDVVVQTSLESPLFELLAAPAGMSITPAGGVITWQPDNIYSQGIVVSDPYCAAVQEPTGESVAFADVVAIVDESGSMSGEHQWIGDFVAKLEQGLVEQNVGEGGENSYGLVGFEYYPREILVGGARMGTSSEFVTAANSLKLYGGTEDGWRSIKHVVDTYPLRLEGARNLLLITDEDRDSTMSLTYSQILNLLLDHQIVLNAVVNATFKCGDGRRALGVDYAGTGYVADGSGGYSICENAWASSGSGTTISNYVNLALATSGAAWDLNYLRSGGHWAQSFSAAMIDIKVKEIVRQSLSLADVTPTNISVDEEQSALSVDIVNRGGGAIGVPMTVSFFSGMDADQGVLLGEVTLAGGIAGSATVPVTLQVGSLEEIQDVFVRITFNGEAEECHTDNNSAGAPLVWVKVGGECNVADRQFFAVNVFQVNQPPEILTDVLPVAETDVEYVHTIKAGDPNIGDSVNFSLVEGPAGLTLNNLSGRIDWLPGFEQKGVHDVVVKVNDIQGLEVIRSYSLTVFHNYLPVVASVPPGNVYQGDTYEYAIEASDENGDVLTYSLLSGPEGLTVNSATGFVTWTPTPDQDSAYRVEVKVADGNGGSIVHQWYIVVGDPNNLPQFTSVPHDSATAEHLYQYQPAATDPDGDPLTLSLVTAPAGMTYANGSLSWQPALTQGGLHAVSLKADDGRGGEVVQNFTILVNVPVPEVTFTVDDSVITNGDSTVLRWTVKYASSISINQGIGTVTAGGSRTISPGSSTTYSITASGPGGNVVRSVYVSVYHPAPIVSFTVSPQNIIQGEGAVLSWDVQYAQNYVYISGYGYVAASGTRLVNPSATTTYYMYASGTGGYVSKSVTLTVSKPAPAVNLTASPASIMAGESSTLSWSTAYAENVTISPDIGPVSLNGSYAVSPARTTTYTVEASGGGGVVSKSVTVVVTYPEPTASLTASPADILLGESATLNWTSTYADTVAITPDIGPVTPSGSMTVSPLQTTTYTIEASSLGGTARQSVTVTVTNPVPTVHISASPATILFGESATLTWSAAFVDSVSIDQDIGQVDLEGALTVSPAETTTYTITGTSSKGTVAESVTITVTYPEPAITLSADAATVREGDSLTLSWTSTNADSVVITPDIGPVALSGSLAVSPASDVTYTATATGKGGTAASSVRIDVYPLLRLTIDSPADGSFTSVPTVTVSGSVTDGASVSVNGIDISVTNNRFSTEVALPSMGDHAITVAARDNYGQQETKTLTVSYAPELTLSVSSPADGVVLAQSSVEVSGQVNNNGSVTVNGEPAAVTGGSFTRTVALPNEGMHTLTVDAVDSYGQQKTVTVDVYYFNVPAVTLDADTKRVQSGDFVTLTWASENCESADLAPGIGHVNCNDTLSLPMSASTEFTIRVAGLGKTARASVLVIVDDPYGDPTPAEQVHLEAINRARANPAGEAARLGIDLNEGPPSKYISPDPVQPLTFNRILAKAARGHSRDMIDNQYFAHAGSDGSTPAQRCEAEGYVGGTGENLAARFSWDTLDPAEASQLMHDQLFVDENYPGRGHRINILNGNYKEAGVGILIESFDPQYPYGSIVTCNFGNPASGSASVLGVVYEDADGDLAYGLGEGLADILVEDLDSNARVYTASAGGYSLPLANGVHTIQVTLPDGRVLQQQVTMAGENIKLDFRADMFTQPATPAVYLYAVDYVIGYGGSTRLVWKSENAVYAEIDNGIGYVPADGSITVSPAETTPYTITVYGHGTSETSTATVYVNDFSLVPAAELYASPATINKGETVTLSWVTENSADVHIDNGIGPVFVIGSITLAPEHSTTYTLTASNASGVVNKKVRVTVLGSPALQPAGSFGEGYNYLIPADATVDSYDPQRFSLVTGTILDLYEAPLAGASVTILDHPEYGTAYTDNNGSYALPVQGGSVLTVSYNLAGYLPVQRKVYVPVNDIAIANTVQLLQEDPVTTRVVLDGNPSTIIVHKSSVVTDAFGARSISMVFQGDNRAFAVDENGNDIQELTSFTTRATEYQTPESMPAELPKTSAFTYCTEMAVDGVDRIRFDKPVVTWVDNFLGFEVGSRVPAGYYDRDLGTWVASDNGITVALLDTDGDGVVDAVDGDGDGLADDLNNNGDFHDEALGLDDPQQYAPGEIYWRVEVTHFTPWDYNYCTYKSLDKMLGFGSPFANQPPCPDCPKTSSASAVSDQSFAFYETIPIPGTGLDLVYASDRTKGFDTMITVPASGTSLPNDLKRIIVELTIAGQKMTKELAPLPNQAAEFIWDGLDMLGNPVSHKVTAYVRVGFVFDSVYMESNYFAMAFNEFGTSLSSVPSREEAIIWQRSALTVNIADKASGLAQGWTLSAHHKLDPTDPATLHKGDGSTAQNITSVMTTAAGTGSDGWPIDGADALATPIGHPTSVVLDADGNLYVSNQVYAAILKIDKTGVVEVIAGGENGISEDDNIDAKTAMIRIPEDMAFDTKGNLYIVDSGAHKIRKIDTNGIITTVAGNGNEESSGDGGLAVNAGIMPTSVAVDEFGNIYFAEGASCVGGTVDPVTGQCIGGNIVESSYRVRKVATNGYISTIVGTGEKYDYTIHSSNGDDGPAILAYLSNPSSVSVDREGNLYIADGLRIRKVNSSGLITTAAGNGASGYSGDGGLATEARITHASGITFDHKGNFYFSQYYGNGDVIRKVTENGYISTVAGAGEPGLAGDNGPATHAQLKQPHRLAIDAFGFIYIPDKGNGLVRKVSVDAYKEGETRFAEANGVGHLISADGYHTETYDLETGLTLLTFGYNTDKQLTTITDQFGNVVTIDYYLGRPYSIISPDGLRTELTIDEYNQLTAVRYPDNNSFTFEYQNNDGLLTAKNEPNGNRFEHFFDANGRVSATNDDEGGLWQFSRTKNYDGVVTSTTVTPNTTKKIESKTYPDGAVGKRVTFPNGKASSTFTSSGGLGTLMHSTCGEPMVQLYSDLDRQYGYTYTRSTTTTTPAGLELTANVEKIYTDDNGDGSPEKITTKTTANNKVSSMEHDILNSTYTSTSPEDRTVSFSYNPNTLQTLTVSVPGLFDTNYSYFETGKLRSVTNGSRAVQYTYDTKGNLASVTDTLDRTTSFTDYDEVGRAKRVQRPDGTILQYSYDQNGNITLLATPIPADNTFTYNGVNNTSIFQTPLGSTTSYSYNQERQLTRVTLPSAKEIVNSYINGRLTQITTSEWTNSYTYSCGSLLDTVTRGSESVSYSWDGNLPTGISQSGTLNAALGFTYNNDFKLTSFSYAGVTNEYQYDNDGLLIGAANFTILRNSDNGLPEEVTDSVYTLNRKLNGYGEIETVEASVSGNSVFTYDLIRDDSGRITTKTESVNGTLVTYAYTYDERGQLRSLTKGSVLMEEYRYDNNGNRTYEMNASRGIGGRSYISSVEDHILTAGDITFTFDYDDYLASRTQGTEITEYYYSATGELMSVKLPDGKVVSYINDPNGRRIAKLVNGTMVEKYLWSDLTTLLAVYDSSDNLLQRFDYSDGRMPVAMSMGGATYYLVYDQVGTLRIVTDSTGNVVKQIDYDIFGNVLSDSGPAFSVPFGFAGGLHDRDTGLVRFGYRDYMPEIGKWTAKDPILFAGGDTNLYGYVANDPVNFVDPTGEIGIFGAILGAGIDLGLQLMLNGGNLKCVNWLQVGAAGALGAIGQAGISNVFKLTKGSMKSVNAVRRYRRLHKVSASHDVHHWSIKKGSTIGKKLPDNIVNHPANLNPVERSVHQQIHNEFNALERWWHGTPTWAKTAQGSVAAGAAGEGVSGDECECP